MKIVRLAASFLALFIWMFLAIPVRADVSLPSLLADHMVVQRGLPVHVWGMAAPREGVTVTFRSETKSTTADDLGRWSLYLSPGEAGGPFSMMVKAANTIVLNDVLAGDVWVASGQSNMEFSMKSLVNADAEIAAAQYPKIRIFRVEHRPSDFPRSDVEAKTWAACTPESAAESSAVAYYFARDLYRRMNVPIGLVESFWGGTAAESWTSLNGLAADASLMPVFAERSKMVDARESTLLEQQQEERNFQLAVEQAKAGVNRRHNDRGILTLPHGLRLPSSMG
jgi:sialate O-acetylesterase